MALDKTTLANNLIDKLKQNMGAVEKDKDGNDTYLVTFCNLLAKEIINHIKNNSEVTYQSGTLQIQIGSTPYPVTQVPGTSNIGKVK